MKRIAVVGAGLAGLSVAWHLQGKADVVVFDAGGGASRISTGLLHPFAGRRALRSWRASEAMAASRAMLRVAEDALDSQVAEYTGALRLALLESQRADFAKRAREDEEAVWCDEAEVLERVPLATRAPALWIPSGVAVYSERYLEGLWRACATRGASREMRRIKALHELANFDAVVLATGSETLQFPECKALPLERVKGQTLVCRWPAKLPCSLIASGHITPTENPQLCQIGSTYEHNFRDDRPDPAHRSELLAAAAAFYPPAQSFEVVEQRAAVRMAFQERGQYRPLVQQLGAKLWVFTALGSRGLLYHALLGGELAAELLK